MYTGPFAQFNPFTPNFNQPFIPSFNPAFFGGFHGGFTPQATPFAFFQGSTQGPWNAGPWSGPTNQYQFQNQFPGQFSGQFPGQYFGQGGVSAGGSGWNPVVTQTSDGFGATYGPGNGFGNGSTSPTPNFTPYSYHQPFYPGHTGTPGNSFTDQTSNPGFNSVGNPNFGGTTFNQQPAFSANTGWYPANFWPGTPSVTPTWNAPTAFNTFGAGFSGAGFAGAGYPLAGYPNFVHPGVNSYPTNGYQALVGSANAGFPIPSFQTNGFPNVGYPLNPFQGQGSPTNALGQPVYNGYTTFPFITNTTPGFPVWNQGGNGFPYYGSAAGPFPGSFAPGSFNPGASNQGWFPGQATFPWYSQVNGQTNGQTNSPQNGTPYASPTGTSGVRTADNGDANAANQPPRGIQFNRDAA